MAKLVPTQGGYSRTALEADVVDETRTTWSIRVKGDLPTYIRKFRKTDMLAQSPYARNEYPCYKLVLTEAEQANSKYKAV